jgi:hypothetical protein
LYINRDYLLTTLMITDDSFRSCSSWKISWRMQSYPESWICLLW